MLREPELLKTLAHPGIVALKDVVRDHRQMVLVLEWLRCGASVTRGLVARGRVLLPPALLEGGSRAHHVATGPLATVPERLRRERYQGPMLLGAAVAS